MKLLSILLTANLASAWVFNTTREAYKGDLDMRCQSTKRNRDDWYAWDGRDLSPRGGQLNCCAYLYTEKVCGGGFANERHCGQYSGVANEDFKSFQVLCAKRVNKN
jgi:hypothetical protein